MAGALAPSLERVDAWRLAPSETQHLEFKEARTQFDLRRLREYCVALANEGGGHLLFGVTDIRPRAVVGTQAFPDTVGTAERLYQSLGFRVNVFEVDHPQGRVLVFEIPSRPRGTAYHLEGRYLMRSGSSLVPMSEDRLRAVFAEGKEHWLYEISARGLSCEDVTSKLDTVRLFELLKLPQPNSEELRLERMINERLIVRDAGGYGITHLGHLLLARDLLPFEAVSSKSPRVITYAGQSKVETIREHPVTRGYAAGFDDLVQSVELQTPAREVIGRAQRRDERAYPALAIRELIANALIHQDLNISGTRVMIELYSDRIEISNPGQPELQFERFIDGCSCRNEPMARLMRRFGLCEDKGSGVDKIICAIEECYLPALEYRVDSVRTTCILRGPRKFAQMTDNDRIRASYQHCCVRYLSEQPMTNQSLRERFRLEERQHGSVSNVIAATMPMGQIKMDSATAHSKRYARYLPFWA